MFISKEIAMHDCRAILARISPRMMVLGVRQDAKNHDDVDKNQGKVFGLLLLPLVIGHLLKQIIYIFITQSYIGRGVGQARYRKRRDDALTIIDIVCGRWPMVHKYLQSELVKRPGRAEIIYSNKP